MNELQRAEYLSALGIPSYMPRFVLPLAPEPRQAELPPAPVEEPQNPLPPSAEHIRRELAPAEAAPQQPAPEQPAAQPEQPNPEVLREVTEVAGEIRAPAAQPAPVAEVAPPQKPVEPFVLSCWWLGGELLAVDSREPGAALPVESLFNNIARALHWHELPREQDRMRWPLAENRFSPAASAAEARDTCSSWLAAASARRPVKSIWLMGQQAQDFCAPVELAETVNDWNGIAVIAMPSLSQLLQQPERKRDLWQLLRQAYPEQTRAR